MKYVLFFLCLSLYSQSIYSQFFDIEVIKYSGDDDKRINLVLLSDGYQTSELSQFITDATNFTNEMFSQRPFAEYENYFNVYAIKVPSNESGASHPGTASDEQTSPVVPILSVDNYFGTTFDSYGVHRLLFTFNTSTITTVLANNFPQYDQALLLVNSPYYGGSGGQFPMASTEITSTEIAIHELGHSFANLKDEYYPGDIQAAEAINMTQNNNPSTVKWKNWLGTNNTGIFQYGTSGNSATWFRPHQSCKMRYLGYNFCSVCTEGIIERIHEIISPIDSYSPTNTTIEPVSFPLDFELEIIQTVPNTLIGNWTLNATEFANDTYMVTLVEDDLLTGINTLTAVVTDETSLVRTDNHNTIHVSMVTWTIDNSTLGIVDITDKTRQLTLSLFPNPTSDLMTIKLMGNPSNTNWKIDVLSIDGKKIQTVNTNNSETVQIDLSNLNQGIYLANIYVNRVRIATQKIIRN